MTIFFAVLNFFEGNDARSFLTYCKKSSGKASDETSLCACMSPALQKSENYIENLANDDGTIPESVFETSAALGSECLSMNLFDAHLKDMFPTIDLRAVLSVSYKHVHASRMRQKHLTTFDSSSSSQSTKFIYFCKQKHMPITSASMILDGSIMLFGVMSSAAIKSTISILHDLWNPLVDIDKSSLGCLEFDRLQDFLQSRETVTDLLCQCVRESASEIQLAFPDASLDIDHVPLHRDAVNLELQRILIEMISSWCDEIDSALVSNDAFFQESSLPPLEEMHYWINRCDSLSVISDQLKVRERRHCAALVSILETKPAQVAVRRFRHAEKALADNLADSLETKSHLMPLQHLAIMVQRSSIADIEKSIPELMNSMAALAMGCRRYAPGLPISLFLGKFSRSIQRCVVIHLRGDFVSTSVMFWSRPESEIMQRFAQCTSCIDAYVDAMRACSSKIHTQQVALNSQNYSAASRGSLHTAIQEDVACQSLLKFKRVLIDLQTALRWATLFASCIQLRAVSALHTYFQAFQVDFESFKSIDLGDLFDLQSNRLQSVMPVVRQSKDALCDACLSYIHAELQAQDTVDKKIDILDLHRDILQQAGPAAMIMVAEHSLVIVQVCHSCYVCYL